MYYLGLSLVPVLWGNKNSVTASIDEDLRLKFACDTTIWLIFGQGGTWAFGAIYGVAKVAGGVVRTIPIEHILNRPEGEWVERARAKSHTGYGGEDGLN